LGSTKVNKAIRDSIRERPNHRKFALFHNGVTILAEKVSTNNQALTIKNFVVVNGAQSLKQLHNNAGLITSDLKILTRVIEIGSDEALAKQISVNSNNQNGIKPRDLRSNDMLQARLTSEFEQLDFEGLRFDVKRGNAGGENIISNEYAGKLLLAFDLAEPWSCHQSYKVFDEKYADIFGRPTVTAARIIFIHKIMELIEQQLPQIRIQPFAHYGLTRYTLLSAIRRMLDHDPVGKALCQNPHVAFKQDRLPCVLGAISDLTKSMVIDINHELVNGQMANYKSDLKSKASVDRFIAELERSYQKDRARNKVEDIGQRLTACIN
jgi:AIPR protein